MNTIFLKKGKVLDKYKSSSQFIFGDERLVSSFRGSLIEVQRDSDNAKMEFGGKQVNYIDVVSFCGSANGYITARWNQKTGNKVDITTFSQQQLIVNAGVLVNYTNKYFCEIPSLTSLTISDISAVNRMKNLNMKTYIGLKNLSVVGYNADYVMPINCTVGLMDFEIVTGLNVFWYLQDNTTSTSSRPAKSMGNGLSFLFTTKNTSIRINDQSTNNNYVGSLKDWIKFSNNLTMENCPNASGNLSDLLSNDFSIALSFISSAGLTGNLSSLKNKTIGQLVLSNINNLEGDLSDLPRTLNGTFSVGGCTKISGNLTIFSGVNLGAIYITSCNLIYGVYTPVTTPPSVSVFTGSGMTTSDIDNTLIAYANASLLNNGTFTATGKNRTVLSDTAVALLISRGWTISVTRI